MHPILFHLQTPAGPLPFPAYGLMMTLAVLAASLIGHSRAQRVGIDPDRMPAIYLICVVAGIAGARLLHFMMSSDAAAFWSNPLIYFNPGRGGLAVYGGLLGGFFAVWAWCRRTGLHFWKIADIMAPAVILGVSIGRIGCFLAGCCHGRVCDLPADAAPLLSPDSPDGQLWLSGAFPHLFVLTRHGVGENNVVVYPTQLWESTATLIIFLLSSVSFRYRRFDGQAVATVAMLYAIWRPINEAMRGDDVRGLGYLGLTTSQFISIPVLLGALLIVAARMPKGLAPERAYAPPAPRDEDLGSAPRI